MTRDHVPGPPPRLDVPDAVTRAWRRIAMTATVIAVLSAAVLSVTCIAPVRTPGLLALPWNLSVPVVTGYVLLHNLSARGAWIVGAIGLALLAGAEVWFAAEAVGQWLVLLGFEVPWVERQRFYGLMALSAPFYLWPLGLAGMVSALLVEYRARLKALR